MFWFFTALIINAIAVLLIIANAVYDAMTLEYSGENGFLNLIGVVLTIVIIVGFSLKNAGKVSAANTVLWIPAAPLGVCFGFFLIYMAIVYLTKPDWK